MSPTGRDQLSRANGRLYAVELTTNQFIGPPLGAVTGGVLAQWLGLQVMFDIMAALCLALRALTPVLTDKAIDAADVGH